MLDNGTVVISKEAHTVPAVTIQVGVKAGSIYDPNALVGLSHLASRVLDRGTLTTTRRDEIAEALDERGVSLTVGANRHVMNVSCTCLSEDFEAMLELVGEIVMQPAFPDQEIDKRKGEVLNAIRQDEDNPAAMAMQALFHDAVSGSASVRPSVERARVDSVSRIERNDLVAFHEARFAPAATTAVIVGDVERERAVAAGRARLRLVAKADRRRDIALPHPPADRPRHERVIPMMNKAQADIGYGFTTIVRSDPRYYAYTLMNNALGQYGIGGPPRRQHPRAAGDGVLRLQLVRRERRRGAAHRARRREPRERGSRHRFDRRGNAPDGGRRADARRSSPTASSI